MTVRGALDGGTLKDIARKGDLSNAISVATASVFLAKDRFKESMPYAKGYDSLGNVVYHMNLHFLKELRRQLSGVAAANTSTFGPAESVFYKEFQEYQNDVPKFGELAIALEALDDWLIDELVGNKHPELERDYSTDHKWNKTEEYTHDKGILWI